MSNALAPYQTLADALFAAPPDKEFVTMWRSEDDFETITFGNFARRAEVHAEYLRAVGVRANDRVILIMPQGIRLMTAFVGTMLLGAIPSILAYPNFKVDVAKYRFGLKGVSANLSARLILVDEEFPEELMHDINLGNDTHLVRDVVSISDCAPNSAHRYQIEANQLAFIQHSAGTTGLQKGVALSHRAVLSHLYELAPILRIGPQDRIYSWLPLYHDMGLIACFMLPLTYHLHVVMQSPTDWVMQPASMLELVSQFRCTLAWIPNFTFQFLARRVRPQDRPKFDLSSLRALINCSEPVRASSMDEFTAAYPNSGLTPTALQSSYAMAETVFAVSQSDVSQPGPPRIWADANVLRREKRVQMATPETAGAISLVSSGICLPSTRVRIVSDDAQELPSGNVGEIAIQSDAMLDGYFNRPDLTDKAIRNGWYLSGDLGFLLDGHLYVVGRKKDLIIVAGENIYPQDVEEIVSAHPAVYDGRVVALGFFRSNTGTEEIIIVAEVRVEADLQKTSEIERSLREALAAELRISVGSIFLKPPRWMVKSTAGKPARSATREKLVSEHAELRVPGEVS